MVIPFTQLIYQRLPYILILLLFFCLVPWGHLQISSFEFCIVIAIIGIFTFQIIKNNETGWWITVSLFSFFSIWMLLAFLSDLNQSSGNNNDFLLYGSLFLFALFAVNMWLIMVKT